MVTLTIVDDATTPSGVVATISASSGGSVSVYYAPFGNTSILSWVLGGTRTGNGTVAIALNPGIYFFYAVDTLNLSSIIAAAVTDDSESATLTAVRHAIAGTIRILGLGLADTTEAPSGVCEQWTPDETNINFPCVILTHENTHPTREMRVVGMSDVGYPVRVMICDKVSRYDASQMPAYDLWRQKISRAFDGQRLLGVPLALICTIEDDVYGDQDIAKYEFMVSQLVIRVKTREPAGIGA